MKEWKVDAIALANAGMSWREIGRTLGKSKSTVSDFLRSVFVNSEYEKPKLSKILLLDIETSPTLGAVWGLWKQNLGINMIERDWFIMSYSAKWYGENKIFYNDCRNTLEDDSDMCSELWDLIHEADIVVAHNIKFDIPKIRARMVKHGMSPPSPAKLYCTLEVAKKNFQFTSNKLEYLGEFLGVGEKSAHKQFPGFSLWAECLKGNEEAWEEMKLYNIQDVHVLEGVYNKLRAWDANHPNIAVLSDNNVLSCPVCGSSDLIEDGFTYTNSGQYKLYNCKECGYWARSRYTLNSNEKRRSLLK